MKTPPANIIRFGLLKCEITRRETSKGAFFNVKLVRMFRNGDEWKESHLLGRDDLLVAAKLLDLAHTWIFAHGEKCGTATNRNSGNGQSR